MFFFIPLYILQQSINQTENKLNTTQTKKKKDEKELQKIIGTFSWFFDDINHLAFTISSFVKKMS